MLGLAEGRKAFTLIVTCDLISVETSVQSVNRGSMKGLERFPISNQVECRGRQTNLACDVQLH